MFKIHSIASGCGQGRLFQLDIKQKKNINLPSLDGKKILSSMKQVLNSTKLHELTRGVHSAALFTISGEEVVFFDEIGRHNAVDKIIGYSYKKKIPLDDKMILSTGRLSSEIVHKCINSKVPVLISKAAPTTLSVSLAREFNLLLICKVSGNSFYIFNGADSIIW